MADVRVAVVGASGFVGSGVVEALRRRGADVVPVTAPRVRIRESDLHDGTSFEESTDLLARFRGCVAVVNAAGLSDAGAADVEALLGANALVPALVARSAAEIGIRLVHVSSAAVQGRRPVLDDSAERAPATAYARSKALGEELVHSTHAAAVVYRPAGVHGADRSVTRRLVSFARGRLSSVSGDGAGNSPQALLEDVADAAAFLALTALDVPAIVHHPSGGVTVRELLELLSDGGCPRAVPPFAAHAAVRLASVGGRVHSRLGALARRLEVLWFGQAQAPSWLDHHGWKPVTSTADWRALGRRVADRTGQSQGEDR